MVRYNKIPGLLSNSNPDLILVNSPLRDYDKSPREVEQEVLPPLGLAYIALEAKRRGFNVGLLDSEFRGLGARTTAKIINDSDTRIAGLNIFTPNRRIALDIASRLDSEKLLLIGGSHATSLPERTIREFSVCHERTVLIKGEAEIVVGRILDGEGIQTLPNTYWLRDGTVFSNDGPHDFYHNLNEMPFLDRGFLENDPSVDRITGMVESRMLGSRGCPYNCTFCVGARDSSEVLFRSRSPDNIAQEASEIPVQRIRMVDDLFLSSAMRANRIFEALERYGVDVKIDSTGRANILAGFSDRDWDTLSHWMSEIALGIESGSERLRRRVNKGVSISDITTTLRQGRKWGINFKGYFIIGLPTESRKETKETLYLARRLSEEYPFRASIFRFRPFPGTAEATYLLSNGYNLDDLLEMEADGSGKRAKHQVRSKYSFGECSSEELTDYLRGFYEFQNGREGN